MKLYYTNPDGAGVSQSDPDKSLGGYISTTQLPSDLFGNLFSTISQYGINNDLRETKALMLQNDTGNTATSITLHFDNNSVDNFTAIEMAVVSISTDGNGDAFIENIINMRAIPAAATFSANEGIGSAIAIPDMDDGNIVGIWVKRTLDQSAIATANACEKLFTDYEADTPPETKEDIDIVINYT